MLQNVGSQMEDQMLFTKAMKGSIAILLVAVVGITLSARPLFCCTPTANMTEHSCCPEAPTHPKLCLEPACSAPQSLVTQPLTVRETVQHIDLAYPASTFEDSNGLGTDASRHVALVHSDKLFLRIHVLLI
jgi:hypothetical protein